MKKTKNTPRLGLLVALLLICALPFSVGGGIGAKAAEISYISLESCESVSSWTVRDMAPLFLEDDVKKEGSHSVRIAMDYLTLNATSEVDAVLTSFAKNGYLEFWLCVENNASLQGKAITVSLQDKAGKSISWNIKNFSEGWNRFSLKLSEGMGDQISHASGFSLRMNTRCQKLTLWLDDVILTDTPIAVSDDELGVGSAPVNDYTGNTDEYARVAANAVNKADIVFSVTLCTIAGGVALFFGTFALVTVLKKRKAGKKHEEN